MDIIPNISTGSKISQNSLAERIMNNQSLQRRELPSLYSEQSNNSNISSFVSTDVSIIKEYLNFN